MSKLTCDVSSRNTLKVSVSESPCSTCAGVAAADASGVGEPRTRTCRTRTAGSGPRNSHRTLTDVLDPPERVKNFSLGGKVNEVSSCLNSNQIIERDCSTCIGLTIFTIFRKLPL